MQSIDVEPRRVTVVLIAVLAVLAGCAGAMNGDSSAGAPQSGGSGQVSYDAGGQGGDGGGGGVGSYYSQDGDRVVVREANMRLRVENFSRAFHRLRTVADRNGGYLGDRSQNSRGEWDAGTVTVRVPPENFADARDAVASLGELENEDVRVLDFTSQYADRQGRIQDLEREERSLQRLLNRTDDVEEAERVREDLREIRAQIRDLERDQASVRQRERLSTIRVDMREPENRQPPENYASAFGFADAFLEAFYGGLTAVKYVIVFFGYAIPVGLALLPLGAFGVGLLASWRRIRRVVEDVLASDGGGARPVAASGPEPTDERPVDDSSGGEPDAGDGGSDAPATGDESSESDDT